MCLFKKRRKWPFLTEGLLHGAVGRELKVDADTTYQTALGQLRSGEYLYAFVGNHLAFGVNDEEDFRLNCRNRTDRSGERLQLFALDTEADRHYGYP